MKKLSFSILLVFISLTIIHAQDVPNHISYYRIYDFIDELANEGLIDVNSAVKPYSQQFIAEKLNEVNVLYENSNSKSSKLSRRQIKELKFYLNEYALELNMLPHANNYLFKSDKSFASLLPPVISYKDDFFRARITPILGMHLTFNSNGKLDKRWYGADFQGMLGKNISIYGSLRDITNMGADVISRPLYLNDEPGYEYTFGADFSDSRGGIKYSNKYMSIGLMKDNIIWGDNYHGSNIISGRAPSFPMIYLQVKPAKWFELNYFHGWLVSNVLDSTSFYIENETVKHYRPSNKYIAANLFTLTPIDKLKLSIGNSIVYAERNIIPSFFIPVAFYKSMDHALTKGLGVENQNSQLFINVSSRNLKHTHFYASAFIDEFQLRRLSPKSKDKNPISYKVGVNVSNFPVKNLSFTGEYTRSNIINYKHSIPNITWASNSYNLGHYLGDNAEEIYASILYKPFRGLDFHAYYINAKHGNEYEYIRRGMFNGTRYSIVNIISNPSLGDVIWTNQTIGFKATYELFRNAYAIVKVENSDIRGHDAVSDQVFGEIRMTAQEALDRYTPKFYQGNNTTLTMGFSLGF
ncbi:hypothetical protein MASR2M117_09070 [Paludibacter sp.]